jgi:hypothetical protein
MLLLASCESEQPQAKPSSSSTSPASPVSSSSSTQRPPLAPWIGELYRAAAAPYPTINAAACTAETPLADKACGEALTAMSNIASTTAQLLSRDTDAVTKQVVASAGQVKDIYSRLLAPIPCYGLSQAAQPPPELQADAQSICAEAADIVKKAWNNFLTDIEVVSGYHLR